ncbi:hypothetical protein GLOIN_2v1785889 [Rhizophagus irregularis DAOM 181602=DAOM 197198]|nr:hypothetical protein GLOIN_2v1785889 [Rhizophagus irregularis DAOM 181602=DAOM 197198]
MVYTAVSAIPELVGHILEYIPNRNFGTHLLEVSPIWRVEAERVLWKRHKEAEEAYDRAVEKKEKANDWSIRGGGQVTRSVLAELKPCQVPPPAQNCRNMRMRSAKSVKHKRRKGVSNFTADIAIGTPGDFFFAHSQTIQNILRDEIDWDQ